MKARDTHNSFWSAVHKGDPATVQRCIVRGQNPDGPLHLAATSAMHGKVMALWLAAISGQLEVVKVLLAAGADIEGGQRWMTPLLGAAAAGHTDIVALLKQHKAKVHFLARVALEDLPAVTRELARRPALARQADECGKTALHYAAARLSIPMAKLLLSHGAQVNVLSAHEETPLFLACDRRAADPARQRRFLEFLLAHGADAARANWRSVTPLHVATRARSVVAVELLLAHGVDVNAKDGGRGSTALDRAMHSTGAGGTAGRMAEAAAIRKLLIEAGAKSRTKTFGTPRRKGRIRT